MFTISTSFIYDLPYNSLVLVFCRRNTSQSRSWNGQYKFFNIQGKPAIIELFSSPTWFCLTLVKRYHNFVIEIDKNINKESKDTLLKTSDNPKYQEVSPIYLYFDIPSILIFLTLLISLILASILPLILSTLAKYRRK